MSPEEILRLKQPAINRGLKLIDLGTGKILLNGKCFTLSKTAQEYMMEIQRTDILRGKP